MQSNPTGNAAAAEVSLKILKSSSHSKLTGNFGEALVLYWLSKYGFECALVDHTGIDIIARRPRSDEVMGISVNSRSRIPRRADDYIRIPLDKVAKAQRAADAFRCNPYFAIVVDAGNLIRVFIVSVSRLMTMHSRSSRQIGWKMRESDLAKYCADPEIKVFELETRTRKWWE